LARFPFPEADDLPDPVDRLTSALADRYQIERELGAGGMATVYLARDIRHDRKVALKVLRPELAAVLGGERFLKEIQLTANLQHPHILALHDSGEADGIVFYVMPYIEGESLRDRLTKEKQLPVEEAVRIATQVAGALDYAHRHGVVHRDIKPENILLHDGSALVADFGIALAASTAGGGKRMTETGMSLGTPHYMSPEQAMGEKEITAKSDVYALGCVLYEMLTAEPPFTGATAQAIVARVMTEEPRSLTLQRRTIPPHVDAAVRKALQKLPADRFASAADFAAALESGGRGDWGTGGPTGGAGLRPPVPRFRRPAVLLPWLVAAAGVAFGGWAWRTGRTTDVAPVVTRYPVTLPDSAAYFQQISNSIAYARDGSAFAYTGTGGRAGIYVRYADRVDAVPVAGERNGILPFFSPDGRWIGYREGRRFMKVAMAGGVPVVICDSCEGYAPEWGTDDTIRFNQAVSLTSPLRQLMAVSAAGGPPRVLATPESSSAETYRFPTLLPDRRTVLFTIRTRDTDRLAALDLRSGRITRFEQLGSDPNYVESGYVVLGNRDGSVVAVPFDLGRRRPSGQPVTIVNDAIVDPVGTLQAGVSTDGHLVYAQRGAVSDRHLTVVGRDGRSSDVPGAPRGLAGPRFAPDGRRLAVGVGEAGGGTDVWTLDLTQQAWTRLTTNRISERPAWTADGRRIVYSSNADLWWIASDGSGTPESLLVATGSRYATSVTPEGTVVFFETGSQNSGIRAMRLDSAPAARMIIPDAFQESAPALSPDGRWLAYQSSEPGRAEVYVRPFPGPGPRVPVSLNGGTEPCWSRDGRELFYREGDAMMAASVRTQQAFEVTERRRLFSGAFLPGGAFREYDVTPDGRRFVMVRGGANTTVLLAVQGLLERLRYDERRQR
jgi:serine/threonine-protein kinase